MSDNSTRTFILRLILRLLALIALLLVIALAVILYYVANPKLPVWSPAQQVHYLEQWSDADRQLYYFTPQGTQVKGLHYEWFNALELPFSKQRFAIGSPNCSNCAINSSTTKANGGRALRPF